MSLKSVHFLIRTMFILTITACGGLEQRNTTKRAWDYENSPERLGLYPNNYKTNFYTLKRKAHLKKKPWSGDYWASYQGGISYRWNHPKSSDNFRIFYNLKPMEQITKEEIPFLSPAEKMDLINNDSNYTHTTNERYRTRVLERKNGFEIPEWFGLCHAWAPATLLFNNPSPLVYKRFDGLEIPLGSSDIKAMLVYFVDQNDSKSYMVSRRCDIDDAKLKRKAERGEISFKEYNRIMNSANCRGVNPGAFHILLANMIGIRSKGFITDVTRDLEVWNQAVYSYNSKVLATRQKNFSPNSDPRTAKEIKIETIMSYISEIDPTWKKDTTSDSLETVKYKYWLELDRNNHIIGGTWISHERPDFLWNQLKPKFTGEFNFLKKIYREATGQTNSRNPISSRRNRTSRDEPLIDSSVKEPTILISSYRKLKSIFGERIEIKGETNIKTDQLKIEYFSEKNQIIKTRWIQVKVNKTFQSASSFGETSSK